MATLTPTLTLASSDTSGDTLNFTVTDSLTVNAPSVNASKINVTNAGANNIIVPTGTAITYLYVKHTGVTEDGSTSTAQLVDIEDTASVAIARLGAGEFAFFPANKGGADTGIQLQVNHASQVQCEYAYWTKG